MVRIATFTKTNAVYYVNSNAALVKINFRAVSCHKIDKLSIFFKPMKKSWCQGVNEMRFRGDTLLTGVLLFESGANRSAEGVSI